MVRPSNTSTRYYQVIPGTDFFFTIVFNYWFLNSFIDFGSWCSWACLTRLLWVILRCAWDPLLQALDVYYVLRRWRSIPSCVGPWDTAMGSPRVETCWDMLSVAIRSYRPRQGIINIVLTSQCGFFVEQKYRWNLQSCTHCTVIRRAPWFTV